MKIDELDDLDFDLSDEEDELEDFTNEEDEKDEDKEKEGKGTKSSDESDSDESDDTEDESDEPEEDSEEDEEDEEVEEDSESEEDVFKVIGQELKKKGVLLLDEDEDFDGTEEDFINKFKKSVEKLAEKKIQDIIDKVHPQYQYMLEYAIKGGPPNPKVELIASLEGVEDLDVEDENVQRSIVSYYYSLQNIPEAKAKKLIDKLDLDDELEEEAREAKKQLIEIRDKAKKELEEEIEKQKKQEEKQYKEFISSVDKTLKSGKAAGFKFTSTTARKIQDFLSNTVKTDQGDMTEFNLKLNSYLSDPEKLVKLAAFVMSDGELFSKTKKETETKATRTLKEKLSKSAKKYPGMKKSGGKGKDDGKIPLDRLVF